MKEQIITESSIPFDDFNNDIDLNKIKNILFRNKKFIILLTFLITLATVIYALTRKEIWQGSFQIIIEPKTQTKSISNKLNLSSSQSNLLGLNTASNSNETQRVILKSPLVLRPVFDFVKNEKKNLGINTKNLNYEGWSQASFNVEYERGTNVLKVNYRDSDKSLILSTLSLISSKYQDYSKKDRSEKLTKLIKYLNEQSYLFQTKSESSQKSLIQFAVNNGFGDFNGLIPNPENTINLKSNSPNKNLLSPASANIRYGSQFILLEKYESNYLDLKSKLKPNSSLLKNLKDKIEEIKESLKRPTEKLLKYRTLERVALRDAQLLNNIEAELALAKLEEAKQEDPWKLISQPKISAKRFYPNRKEMVLIGFSISILISSILAIIKEKNTNLIYEFKDIKDNLDSNFISNLFSNKPELNLQIVKRILEINDKDKIGYIYALDKNIENKTKNKKTIFESNKSLEEIKIFDEEEINNHDKIFVVCESQKVTYKNLKILNLYLKCIGSKNIGWFYLEKI